MERRRIGRTDLMASTLGFGGGPIGNLRRAISDLDAETVLDAAWTAGIRYFDTAPLYGLGRSELRLGAFLRCRPRDEFVLATKVGRLLVPSPGGNIETHGFVDIPPFAVTYDYSHDGALRSIEASLARLRLDRIDIALVHDIDGRTHGPAQPARFDEALSGAWRALVRLKAEGVVGAIGLGVNEWQVCRDWALRAEPDLFLLAGRYTLLEQAPAAEFLPLCRERGISLVIGGPYNTGILVTGPVPGAWYNYAPATPEILERVRQIEAVLRRYDVPLPAAALQFPLQEPAVATVIPGLMSPAEVATTVAAMSHDVPDAAWNDLRSAGLIV
ncbi:MAG: aldo/keto reductase [Geminicoccaceae bacterium]